MGTVLGIQLMSRFVKPADLHIQTYVEMRQMCSAAMRACAVCVHLNVIGMESKTFIINEGLARLWLGARGKRKHR